jgi:tRNA(fMet)-specific endonuclease VapC
VKPRYLLDTNILSEPLAATPNRVLLARLKRHEGELATASVVWHELVFGASRLPESRRRATIERYLEEVIEATIPIIAYDAGAAAWHGAQRARLQGLGVETSFADGQIAAVARVNDLVLVTRNVKDFRPFKGLPLENWFAPDEQD